MIMSSVGDVRIPTQANFLTPFGQIYTSVAITVGSELPLNTLMGWSGVSDQVMAAVDNFQESHPLAFNGLMLGSPQFVTIDNSNGRLEIEASKLRFFNYLSLLSISPNSSLTDQYSALSVCCIVFDTVLQQFYFSIRPKDALEKPGLIDAPGGCLSPDSAEEGDPYRTIWQRLKKN